MIRDQFRKFIKEHTTALIGAISVLIASIISTQCSQNNITIKNDPPIKEREVIIYRTDPKKDHIDSSPLKKVDKYYSLKEKVTKNNETLNKHIEITKNNKSDSQKEKKLTYNSCNNQPKTNQVVEVRIVIPGDRDNREMALHMQKYLYEGNIPSSVINSADSVSYVNDSVIEYSPCYFELAQNIQNRLNKIHNFKLKESSILNIVYIYIPDNL